MKIEADVSRKIALNCGNQHKFYIKLFLSLEWGHRHSKETWDSTTNYVSDWLFLSRFTCIYHHSQYIVCNSVDFHYIHICYFEWNSKFRKMDGKTSILKKLSQPQSYLFRWDITSKMQLVKSLTHNIILLNPISLWDGNRNFHPALFLSPIIIHI